MDEGTQKHLDLEQDAALSSIGPKSTTPGMKVNPDMAEMTRRLEQAYTVLIEHLSEEELSLINATIIRMSILLIKKVQKNDTQEIDEEVREMDGADKGVRGILQDVAASLAGKNSSGSVGYDALKEMCSSIIARSKDLLTSLWRTCKKKAWDQAPNFILRGVCTLYPDVDLAFAIKHISSILRIPWTFSHEIGSFLAAKYPWLKFFTVYCCYMTLAALPYVLIIWIHSWSLTTGVPHAPTRGSLLMIALVLFSWIGLAALTLELPAPKRIDVLE